VEMHSEAGIGRLPGMTKPRSAGTKRSPDVSGPKLLPKKKTISRQVFLEPEMWAELSDAANFHSEVFEVMGAGEKVSRNDVIASFLRWALDSYWEDKGGRPTTVKDRQAKVDRHAAALSDSESDSSE
jgi:hypothetical protein